MQITTFGELDQRAYDQLLRCAHAGSARYAVLCADHHVGYSQPIGGAIAYSKHISPSGVGYDIGCGNKAVLTDLQADEIDVSAVMNEIVKRISFGMGRINNEPVDHPVLNRIARAAFAPQRRLLDLAAEQLGTVGSGNHYVDLFRDEAGRLWIGVHFGSRGFGHKTATGFLALGQGLKFEDRAPEGHMDSPPVLFTTDSALGQDYIAAMQLAGEYAYAGRDLVVEKVLQILGAKALESVHNHHNFAWHERHFDTDLWVVRKGCTPAFPGQLSFVGASMAEPAVILEGVEADASRRALYSTVHGAGRVMSRTQAAGRRRWKRGKDGIRRPTIIKPGVIDWAGVQKDMKKRGIELRGGGADEAPQAYKRLSQVLAYHAETIHIRHTLHPIGVAMAGEEIEDPYRD